MKGCKKLETIQSVCECGGRTKIIEEEKRKNKGECECGREGVCVCVP